MKKTTVSFQLLLLLFSLLHYDVSNAMKRNGSPFIEQQPLLKKSKRDYLCTYDDCNKSFDSPALLEIHIRIHTKEKPFKCSMCHYDTSQSGNLNRHMKAHTGEKQFKCTWPACTKAFLQNYELISHMRTHTGERPFKCSMCYYAASQSSNLNRHMRTHTGEKPFKCSMCHYAASQSSTLNTHMKIHTGEKPFKCTQEQGGEAFSRKHILINHEKKQHTKTCTPLQKKIKPIQFAEEEIVLAIPITAEESIDQQETCS